MKSLKKTLSLVLVLVMVLGMFGIASATSFTDDATIQYKEAVDVMTGIGAIDGYADGTFRPTATVTRAEAAKMVTYAILGASVASTLTGVTSSFTDVPATYSWAIPSIEYLVKIGAVNGRGDGTFDPQGSVTAYEIAKMMLCAAGYGKQGEYVGNDWKLSVAIDANRQGITSGSKAASFDVAATREECALYTFNGLTGVAKVAWSKDTESYVNANGATSLVTTTIADATYGATLVHTTAATTGTDDFLRSADVWTYKGKVIGSYPVAATFTFTATTSPTAMATALKGYTFDVGTVSHTNGYPTGVACTADATVASLTGNGTVVQVYTTGTVITNIVVIRTTLYSVTVVNPATKAVTLAIDSDTNTPIGPASITIAATDDLYAAVKGLAVGEQVLAVPYYSGAGPAYNKLAAISMPTEVTGSVTAVSSSGITVGGKTYPVGNANVAAGISAATPSATEITLVLDSYGYVLDSYGATLSTVNRFYAFDEYTTVVDGKLAYMATGVWNDGTVGDVRVSAAIGAGDLGKVYQITAGPTAAGIYTLGATTVTADGSSGAFELAVGNVKALTATKSISSTDRALTVTNSGDGTNGANNYYASNVKFIFISSSGVTVKEGVQNVPNIPANSFALAQTRSSSSLITAVFIGGDSVTYDASSLIYVEDDTATGAVLIGTTSVPTYVGYLNGEAIEVPMATSPTAQSFHTYVKASSGIYTLTAFTSTAATIVEEDEGISSPVENRLYTVNGVVIDISGAIIVDVRSANDQASEAISPTAAGITYALGAKTVKVSVIYGATTYKASVIYITSVS